MIDISVVVPVYNEEESIFESYIRLRDVLDGMKKDYELIFVNDGSRDRSMAILTEVANVDPRVKIISLARNFGHQLAVSAGLMHVSGETVVIIDADLQDPPELIPDMYAKWAEGYQVVYGKRNARDGESFFKLFTAKTFYKIINALSGNMVPVDTGDFRLIDRQVADTLNAMPEHARFLRGMGSWVGYKQFPFPYERDRRFAGSTKYTLKKMLKLAEDGIVSFSTKPLAMAYYVGGLMTASGLVWLIILLIMARKIVSGWPIVVAFILLVGGLIMLAMGIIGTYIGRIYEEAKGRPLYVIAEKIGFKEEK